MTEQSENNLPAGENNNEQKFDDDFIANDAQPLCPKCLQPCNPMQNYCANCGCNEVINPLASYMPFVRIRFNIGMFCKMWRRTWYDKESSTIFRFVCWVFIILFTIIFFMHLPA